MCEVTISKKFEEGSISLSDNDIFHSSATVLANPPTSACARDESNNRHLVMVFQIATSVSPSLCVENKIKGVLSA